MGDGYLLNQLTKKRVIFKFRENDILNSGEGAPLTPIYHQHLVTQKKIDLPVCVLNIGGISNITIFLWVFFLRKILIFSFTSL